MSVSLMLSLWKADLPLTPIQRLVLECLAYYTNDNKNDCYPSYTLIAKKCCMCRNTVIKSIKQLCFMNILSCETLHNPYTGRTINHYKINTNLIKECAKKITNSDKKITIIGAPDAPDECISLTPQVHHVHPTSAPDAPYLINNLINNLEEYNVKMKDESLSVPESPFSLVLRNNAKQIIDFLKVKAGRNYRYTETSMKLIMSRLKEGVTVEECKQVIARKQMEWGNDKVMKKFIRPTTLFNKTNLHDKYLPELVTEEEQKKIMNRG